MENQKRFELQFIWLKFLPSCLNYFCSYCLFYGSEIDIVIVDGVEARNLVASGHHRYLDVRMEEDFEKGHLEGALNVPYYSSVTPQEKVKNLEFIEQVASLLRREEPFIVGCRTGVRAKRATIDLLNAGFTNVKYLAGGYMAWLKSGNEDTSSI
ncbi:thiosulfate sulfurtransferase 16, chloroplastic-like [Curcuma longa]|uniref:thiosulfate sulfurtransferase 16, chloroplastic-like n=1 Tax=Curcuma longa TaxID=136217 RepID=UPI003D9F026E